MNEAFIGEIRMFGGNYPPLNWELCNGQLLPISEYEGLYALISTTFGGDGQTTFALPDLRARIPVHRDTTHVLGSTGGAEQVMLTEQNVPNHSHPLQATAAPANSRTPAGNLMLATTATALVWSNASPESNTALSSSSISYSRTGGQPVPTVAPSLPINFIICTEGIFPPRD